MGRIFLAPTGKHEDMEFWINFGWNTRGYQRFPDWIPELETVCSQGHYDALMADLREYLTSNSISFCTSELSSTFFCLVLPLLMTRRRASQIQQGIESIVDSHKALIVSSGLRFETVEQATTISRNVRAYDQFGEILEAAVGSGNYGSRLHAVWPPLGYNLIFRFPADESLRSKWPPVPVPSHETLPASAVPNR
jgi:hypothetical protein